MTSHADSGNYDLSAYSTFTISGDDVSPHDCTSFFGVKPDISVEKGKAFQTPSVRMSTGVGKTSIWGLSSRSKIESRNLDDHIRYLIEMLNLFNKDLSLLMIGKPT